MSQERKVRRHCPGPATHPCVNNKLNRDPNVLHRDTRGRGWNAEEGPINAEDRGKDR